MRHAFAALLIIIAISNAAPVLNASTSQDYQNILNSIDVNRMLGTVKDLTGDDFAGRQSGTQGATLASDYISNYFGSLGLKSAGSDGAYRTQFTMPLWKLVQAPSLAMVGNTPKAFAYRKDFSVQPCSDSGDYSAEAIFVGYGISANDLGYDDYYGINASGKITVAIAGTPKSDKFQNSDYGGWASKVENALNHSAIGLILVDSPRDPARNYVQMARGGWKVFNGITILRGSTQLANSLLGNTPLSSLQEIIDQSLKPKSFSMGKTLQVSVKVSFNENSNAYNVLGYIPGSEPTTTQRVLIIGAHYDHHGTDVDGSIFHGANDNASGVAVLMEIAKIFLKVIAPRSAVLFAAPRGEEEGLFGSSNYVRQPHFPLSQTEAYLNLDMVGCCSGLTAIVSEEYSKLRGMLAESANVLQMSLKVQKFSGGSDHVPFEKKHVSNMMLIYEPLDAAYHTPADTVDHLLKQDLLDTAKLTALMALKLLETPITTNATFVQTETRRLNVASTNDTLITIIVVTVIVGSLVYITKRKHLK